MSFTSNPYVHMGIKYDDSLSLFTWECESCGGTGELCSAETPIGYIRGLFLSHVMTSHKRFRRDFEGWS